MHAYFACLQRLASPRMPLRLTKSFTKVDPPASSPTLASHPLSQGNSLSPLLFILFIEPLLRGLHITDRGYKCASSAQCMSHYATVLAAADDPAVFSGSVHQLQRQLDKVQGFAAWSGMQVAPTKSIASACLWGTNAVNDRYREQGDTAVEGLLTQLKVDGQQLHCISMDTPFRFLGAWLTMVMTMNCSRICKPCIN